MKVYRGEPPFGPVSVTVTDPADGESRPLHYPDSSGPGFAWGYEGAGALALAEALVQDVLPGVLYTRWSEFSEPFYMEVVRKLPERWTLYQAFILTWIRNTAIMKGQPLELPGAEVRYRLAAPSCPDRHHHHFGIECGTCHGVG